MENREVSISSFQKNVPELLDVVLNGDEIIITKSNIPVAKIIPINAPKIKIQSNFLTARAIETKRSHLSEPPENWFG